MAFDFKKEYKEFYLPPKKPGILNVPAMNYVAVRGKGNPNDEKGEYKKGIGLLYAIAFTIKMSYKRKVYRIDLCHRYSFSKRNGIRLETVAALHRLMLLQ